jgi:UDP-N-acetylmuramoyl-tripeptide--D-alanyl-D-alanine ligase
MLGAMMELGKESVEEHHSIVDLINQYNWKKIVLVGGDFSKISHHHTYFDTASKAAEWFAEQEFEDCHILIKGSRSMQMEKILDVG